jgi:protocatechuate 3,4-dioxygenase beta subunit
MLRNFALILALLLAPSAYAASCTPSPSIATQNYPGFRNIPNGNNLLKPAGKAVESTGQRVVIYGTLFDRQCVPVADALVELWQVDPFGKWMLANREDLVNPNPVFAGAGRTYTDESGRFYFVTAFPAAVGKRAPHFDLRIAVRDQKDFSTVLYFADDGRNAKDGYYAKLGGDARQKASLQVNEGRDGLSAAATIVLPYKVPYRGY